MREDSSTLMFWSKYQTTGQDRLTGQKQRLTPAAMLQTIFAVKKIATARKPARKARVWAWE
jgi:hypothetical protein